MVIEVDAVVRDIDEELRRWRCAAPRVRAIASVPRTLLSPLVASFWIGGWVGFSTSSAVNPPPWIMNPGMTRWKMVPG